MWAALLVDGFQYLGIQAGETGQVRFPLFLQPLCEFLDLLIGVEVGKGVFRYIDALNRNGDFRAEQGIVAPFH